MKIVSKMLLFWMTNIIVFLHLRLVRSSNGTEKKPPHIILIVADDLGKNYLIETFDSERLLLTKTNWANFCIESASNLIHKLFYGI